MDQRRKLACVSGGELAAPSRTAYLLDTLRSPTPWLGWMIKEHAVLLGAPSSRMTRKPH